MRNIKNYTTNKYILIENFNVVFKRRTVYSNDKHEETESYATGKYKGRSIYILCKLPENVSS